MNIKKHHLASLFVIIAIIAATLPFISPTESTQAAPGTRLYLSPASQTVTTGSNVVVSVSVDTSGASINTVQSVLSYSAANFSLVSITPGSAFGSFPNSASSGSIQFSAGSTSAVTGVQTVATVTLHSTGAGTSAINLAGVCPAGNYASTCSAAYDSVTSNNDLSAVSNGSYTVTAAPVTPAPTPTPASAGSSPSSPAGTSASTSSGSTKKASSGSTSTTAPSTTSPAATSTPTTTTTDPAPVISGVKVSDTSANNATVTWQTNIPATSIVNYGLNDKYGLVAQSGKLTTAHQVKIGTSSLAPGTAYYFAVASATASGASATGGAGQFTTAGFDVTMKIVDKHGKPIKGAKVTSGSQSSVTDSGGSATLRNLPAGAQPVTIRSGFTSTKLTFTVGKLDPKTGTYQQQAFTLTAARGSNTAPYIIVALFALLAAGIVLFAPLGTMVSSLQRIGRGPGGMGASGGPAPSDPGGDTPGASGSNSPIQVIEPGSEPATIASGTMPTIKINNIQLGKAKNPQPGSVVEPNETKT